MSDLKPLSQFDKLLAVIDMDEKMRDVYERLYSIPPEEWTEEHTVAVVRYAFACGLIVPPKGNIRTALKEMGYSLTR